MKYPLILNKIRREVWCITPTAFDAICSSIADHDHGDAAPTISKPLAVEFDALSQPKEIERSYAAAGETAIIPLFGVFGQHLSMLETMCGGIDTLGVASMLDEAGADEAIKNVVLYFNSPGGIVTGIPELAEKIRHLRGKKQVIAYTDDTMTSAAYWLGAQADALYMSPSAEVGSVGVYCLVLDESRALEREGVKVESFSAGAYKLMGASFKPITDADRKIFQEKVDKTYGQFKAEVRILRDIKDENLQGQMYDGEEAIAAGLADGIMSSIKDLISFLE